MKIIMIIKMICEGNYDDDHNDHDDNPNDDGDD